MKTYDVTVALAGGNVEQTFPLEAPSAAVAKLRAPLYIPEGATVVGVDESPEQLSAYPNVVYVHGILCIHPAKMMPRTKAKPKRVKAAKVAKPAKQPKKPKRVKAAKTPKPAKQPKAAKPPKAKVRAAKAAKAKAEKVAKGKTVEAEKAVAAAIDEKAKAAEAQAKARADKAQANAAVKDAASVKAAPAKTKREKTAKKAKVKAARVATTKAQKSAKEAAAEKGAAVEAEAIAKAKAEEAATAKKAAELAKENLEKTKGGGGARPVVAKSQRGKRRGVSKVESILFLKSKWTPATAEEWLKKEGKRFDKLEDGGPKSRYWHFRQFEPTPGLKKRMQPFGDVKTGIKAVVEIQPRAKKGAMPASAKPVAPPSSRRARSAKSAAGPKAKRQRKPAAAAPPTQRAPISRVSDEVVLEEIERRLEQEDPSTAPGIFADFKAIWLGGGREKTLAWMKTRQFPSVVDAFEDWFANNPAMARDILAGSRKAAA